MKNIMKTKSHFIKSSLIYLFIIIPFFSVSAQLDLDRFQDSAHHWYDINDEERIINPFPDRPMYRDDELRKIADNIMLFQKDNGGWAKNFDMQAILSEEQRKRVINDKSILNTTFDNGATHSHLTYLAEVYTITKEEKYKNSFMKGFEFILSAQYDNGGWPQKFPDTSSYHKYITFNDGAMMGIMKMLRKIITRNSSYLFISKKDYSKAKEAYEKGLACIIDMQITENGKASVWCQQHDNVTLKPRKARAYEHAAICNGESSEIVMFLMGIENPSDKIIKSVKSAVEWFNESAIYGIRIEVFEAPKEDFIYHTSTWDRKVVEDLDAPRIWARFYEFGTHKPLFSKRDGTIVYSMAEVDRDRRTGYGWYIYTPEAVLSEFSNWLQKIK